MDRIDRSLALIVLLFCFAVSIASADLIKPRIEVFKAKRELQLWDGDKLVKTYHIALGENPVPPKERKGDKATPEGSYFICDKNPNSKFHLSLAISYPNAQDAKRGLKAGLISRPEYSAILKAVETQTIPPWNTKLGGEVFVHGSGSSPDWTWGCVALENSDIEELYRLVPLKTPITIHH
jgi:murein L,D-transpeptidase YafK